MAANVGVSEQELYPLRRSPATSPDDVENQKMPDGSADEALSDQSSSDDVSLLLQQPGKARWNLCRRGILVAALISVLGCSAYFATYSAGFGIKNSLIPGQRGATVAKGLHAHANHYSKKFAALVTGKRHCRPNPDSLLGRGVRPKVTINRQQKPFMAKPRQQWKQKLATARKRGLLTIMTPVFPDNATLGLLHNQLRSANKYLHMGTIHEWLLVTPASQVDRLADFLEDVLELLPCVLPSKIRIVPDEACAPELRPWKMKEIAARCHRNGHLDGWYKQQLLKLACSFTVQTPFFLITDADTFFLAEVSALDLMEQRPCTPHSAVCDREAKIQFRSRSELQPPRITAKQESWVVSSAQTLKMPPVRVNSENMSMGVTPQTMSTAVVSQMAYYLEANVAEGNDTWRTYLLDFAFHSMVWINGSYPNGFDWPSPWTEYELYFGFSQNRGLWDAYHVHDYLQNEDANLWNIWDLPDWKPCESANPGYWAVVQSMAKIKATTIWKRLAPCMDLSNGLATRGVYDDDAEPGNQFQRTNTTIGT